MNPYENGRATLSYADFYIGALPIELKYWNGV
jgi:hypothetical protein